MATYLITQATGGQSGWVITHLLAAGAKVHAMVRDLNKELPAVLKSPGVTLFEGESTDFDAIYRAARGCRGVFLNTVPYPPGLEVRQAQTVVAAAREASGGVEMTVVASSTLGADDAALRTSDAVRAVGLDGYYASKHGLEEAVRRGGFASYTILRPAVLHYDFFNGPARAAQNYPRLPTHGELSDLLDPGRKIPFTDAHDVGRYAAAALLEGEEEEEAGRSSSSLFAGQEIDLAHELFDFDELAALLRRVTGKRGVRVVRRTPAELQALGAAAFGQTFHRLSSLHDFAPLGAAAPAVQARFGIPFTSLEAALTRDKALLMETVANLD